jgi:predicted dithiol-disulfide oxidoreductase (DUF899 family)
MSLPDIVSREEWLVARRAILAREKELTRQKDALNADRRRMPMVRVEKDYRFEGPDGPLMLRDLFDGNRQLVIQHFMFDPSWGEGCSSCTADCDETSDGKLAHLRARDTAFAVVARAPYKKIATYKAARGWSFPFVSSFGSEFNYDFHATIDESVAPMEINFRSATTWPGRKPRSCTGSSSRSSPSRTRATASSSATARRSSTPTRPSPAAPSGAPTPTAFSTRRHLGARRSGKNPRAGSRRPGKPLPTSPPSEALARRPPTAQHSVGS